MLSLILLTAAVLAAPPMYTCTDGGSCRAAALGEGGVDLETCQRVCLKDGFACFNHQCVPQAGGVNKSTCASICEPEDAVLWAPTRTLLFNGTSEMRSNPERGFRHEIHPNIKGPHDVNTTAPSGTVSAANLAELGTFNLTVAQLYYYLPCEGDPCNETLPAEVIEGVATTLKALRSVGVKALWRFAYDQCDTGDGDTGTHNYTATTILAHIAQLKDIFLAHIDAVYVLQAGFVGCWGEWHGAKIMLNPFGPGRAGVQQMLQAELFDLLPPDRKIMLRYPAAKFDSVLHRDCAQTVPANTACGGFGGLVPSGELPPPDPSMAFGVATAANFKDNTAAARLGYDNDFFMCDQTGGGTWVGGAQHDGDVPRTSRVLQNGQLDPRDGKNGQIPVVASYGDPVFNSAHGPMLGPGYSYEKAESPFVPMDAEMGWLVGLKEAQSSSSSPSSSSSSTHTDHPNTRWPRKVPAETAAWRLREMHYSTMSLVHGYSHLDGLNKTTHLPNNNETIDSWMQHKLNITLASRDFRLPIAPVYANAGKSGYQYIRDHLGYRLELRSAALPEQLTPTTGGASTSFVFSAALLNWGFAAPISPRPVMLVLLAANNSIVWRSASLADPRDFQPFVPGDPTYLPALHRITARVEIPAAVVRGLAGASLLRFGLFMPDMRMAAAVAAGVGADYCVRLANDGVDWVNGVNVLAAVKVVV